MGLLDQFSEFARTPEGQGLLSAAFGGLAGARRGQPLNSIGRAGLAGLQGYGGALDRQQQDAEAAQAREIRGMQLTQAKDAAAAKQRQQEWLQSQNPALQGVSSALADGGGPTPANAAKIQQVDPYKQKLWEYASQGLIPVSDYISAIKPKQPERQVVDGTLLEVGEGGIKELWAKPEKVDPNKPFMMVDGKVTPNPAYQSFELEKASRGASRTNVTVDAAPKAFWGDYGKKASEELFAERDGAKAAVGVLQSVGQIKQAVQGGAYQGAGAEIKLGAAKALGALGMPYDAKTVANTELFNAQANQFVLNSIKQLGQNPSNADREFIEKTVPRLSTDPAALPSLLNFMEGKARNQVRAYNSKIKGVQSQPMGASIPMNLEVPEPEMPTAPSSAMSPGGWSATRK